MIKQFDLSPEQKELLQKTSSFFGIKQDIIKEVWVYTTFMYLMDVIENDKKFTEIELPYIGKIFRRFDMEEDNTFIIVNKSFNEAIENAKKGKTEFLVNFLRDEIMKPIIENTEELI